MFKKNLTHIVWPDMPGAYCDRGSFEEKFVQLEVAWIGKEIKELLRDQNFGKRLSLTLDKKKEAWKHELSVSTGHLQREV